MKLYTTGILIGCLLLLGGSLKAQSQKERIINELRTDSAARTRFVTRSTLYGIGYANVYDTYLSPQEYTGIDFRLSRESMRMTGMMKGNVSRQSFFQSNLSYTHNRVDNNNTISGLVNWNYGLHYNFQVTPNLKLLAGSMIDLNGGFIYNLRNSNNPASARAYINLMATPHNKYKGKCPMSRTGLSLNLGFAWIFAPYENKETRVREYNQENIR